MFRRIRWRLLASYLIVVAAALTFLGVHLVRQFEAAFTNPPAVDLSAQLQHVRWVVAWGTVVAMAIAAGLGLVLARGIANPVQEMTVVAAGLAAGRLSERVPVRTRDELGDLARSLNYMAEELERIDSLRRAFIADASHELRTPVANLSVAVEALKTVIGRDDRQAEALASDVEREVARLSRLVESLLDLSRVEADTVHLRLEPVAPAELVTRAVGLFLPRAEGLGIALRTEVPARLSRVRVDADRIIQVLSNLLDNAVKFTGRGGGVTVRAVERGGHVVIGVADTGPGIPAAELAHIFDRFYKVDKSRAGTDRGAGLGLAIAKRLVEAQGGILMAESAPGAGSVFSVALPKES